MVIASLEVYEVSEKRKLKGLERKSSNETEPREAFCDRSTPW